MPINRMAILFTAASWLVCQWGVAQVTFTQVVDESILVPGSGSTFAGFSDPVATGGAILFEGSNFNSSTNGIYTSAGGVSTIADLTTPVPGGGGNFTGFQSFAASGGNVVFEGFGAGRNGVYSTAGGIHTVADTLDLVPGSATNFNDFSTPSISSTSVAFIGAGPGGVSGVYTANASSGPLTTIVDTTSPLPGNPGEMFANFQLTGTSVSVGGGDVAFNAFGNVNFVTGVYRGLAGSVALLLDDNTSLPGGGGTFTSFNSTPQIDGNATLFRASGTGLQGIYSATGGGVTAIADSNTLAPGGSNFASFGLFSADSRAIAFEANLMGGQTSLYYYDGMSISLLLAPGDMVDSQTISSISIGEGALSGTQLAVNLGFTNGNSGIYSATVPAAIPEPSVATLLIGLVSVVCLRRSRRKNPR